MIPSALSARIAWCALLALLLTYGPISHAATSGSAPLVAAPAAVADTADLFLQFEGGRGQVRPGNNIDYDLFVFNSGPDAAAAAFIEIALPSGATFVSFTRSFGTSPPWLCTTPAVGATGNIRCDMAAYPHVGGAFFDLVLRASPGTVGSVLTATATIGSSTPDPDTSDNSESAVSLVQSGSELADIALTITDSPDPVLPGADINYTLTLNNNGADTAVSGVLRVNFPEADDIDLAVPEGWACEFLVPPPGIPVPPAALWCDRRILPTGVSIFTFVVRTRAGDSGPLVLGATALSATTDPNTANNVATATTNTIFGASFAVPALSPALLAFLAVLLATIGMRATPRRD